MVLSHDRGGANTNDNIKKNVGLCYTSYTCINAALDELLILTILADSNLAKTFQVSNPSVNLIGLGAAKMLSMGFKSVY